MKKFNLIDFLQLDTKGLLAVNGGFLRESFLCLKKRTCSEIFYIIVNNSEHDESITLSDHPYWTELFSGDKYDLINNFECKSQEFYLMYHTENNYV